jgi:hypothetical protein
MSVLGPDNILAKTGAKMLGLVRHLREVEGPSGEHLPHEDPPEGGRRLPFAGAG